MFQQQWTPFREENESVFQYPVLRTPEALLHPADILRSGAAHLLPGWPVLWSGKARLPARAHLPGRSSEQAEYQMPLFFQFRSVPVQ